MGSKEAGRLKYIRVEIRHKEKVVVSQTLFGECEESTKVEIQRRMGEEEQSLYGLIIG